MFRTVFRKKTFTRIVAIFFCVVFFPSSVIAIAENKVIPFSFTTILYVGGNGLGNYTRIQDAIDNASDGDTVFVFEDSSPYFELIRLNKSINLIGEDKNSTVIDGDYVGLPVNISSNNCLVSGFTIKNCKLSGWYWEFSTIKIYKSNNVKIINNIITLGGYNHSRGQGFASISIHDSSYNIIQDNYIFEEYSPSSWSCSGIAIHDGSSYNLVTGNEITEYDEGVYTYYSNNNNFSKNYIHNNTEGVNLRCDNSNKILNNLILNNEDYGITFFDSSYNTIIGNNISNNGGKGCYNWIEGGILLDEDYEYKEGNVGSNFNYFSSNIISNNNATGIIIANSYNNIVTRNNFIDNYGADGYPQRWWGSAFFIHIYTKIIDFFKKNYWNYNYWSDCSGDNAKKILGVIGFFPFDFPFLWVNFDRHPAKEPYDI